jgi:hypothetical protein
LKFSGTTKSLHKMEAYQVTMNWCVRSSDGMAILSLKKISSIAILNNFQESWVCLPTFIILSPF